MLEDGVNTIKKIGELVKRRKVVTDACVRQLRLAEAAEDAPARQTAALETTKLLSELRAISKAIDALYVEQIAELEALRADAARQGAEAIAAAQGAILRLTGPADA